ncbi:putative RNG2 protein, RAS GTPase-activating-like protein [Monocercomonoides exilis]|uniref:putative RNG2 protein, RAS GTPase-activating-like protein n=1 Tax=Monocercomonoides exilis TaxID=2049356 RepID=UPI00355A01A9|nr:putative RNG2 protein, RAS GTPase-activating-like protein [Monocercomonoides exilis]|eukprot:MONOS_8644.1-p1 / transcript=MONOS_8644.1 / gene=MONOS_8644 / organism=Monocercomonoides_exilis_PA203 / gene_product=RNG2 protein, RAS GTPase-activating-like protein / transcript_product=RNG2 protein, RAS GTPase-activating-like protein / location=Mono_scaffold00331:18878-19898(+) / protein_length=251 / sequence_SO=supercontig / SO=protein_coding / is_pseudo=false
MDTLIRKNKVVEFLRLEYKVKTFLDQELNEPLKGSITDAVKDGTLIEFLNEKCSGKPVGYNKNPKETFARIDNIRIFNNICENQFGIPKQDLVDIVQTDDSLMLVQILTLIARIFKLMKEKGFIKSKLPSDADCPKTFEENDMKRGKTILEEATKEMKKEGKTVEDILDLAGDEEDTETGTEEDEDKDVRKRDSKDERKEKDDSSEEDEEEKSEAKSKKGITKKILFCIAIGLAAIGGFAYFRMNQNKQK